MKKALATLLALTLVMTVAATAALAEESAPLAFTNGVQFNMDMDQVIQLVNQPNPEIDKERTRGSVEFWELEYEHIIGGDGLNADIKFIFVGNSLVAIHYDMEDGSNYESVKETLVKTYGETVPFDAAKIGNGRFVIDDDGDLEDCQEMVVTENLIIVLEKDHEGDVDVTFLNPAAAFLSI